MSQINDTSEKNPQNGNSRISKLRLAYDMAIHSLLCACSEEEFKNIFSALKQSDCERLYQLYLKIIPCVHGHVKEEFELICQETGAMAALGRIEQLIENQKLDALHEEKPLVSDIKRELARRKLKEIHHLEDCLEKVQDQNLQYKQKIKSLHLEEDGPRHVKHALTKLKDHNATLDKLSHDKHVF